MNPAMKINNEIERDRIERNRLVLAVFIALCAGLLLAMVFGALPDVALKTDEWVAVSIAAIAAGISGYAVYLVNQTLEATRKTLEVTQAMAKDQKRIGDAQTRAWLLIEKCHVKGLGESPHFIAILKNFGKSPASMVNIKATTIMEDHSVRPILERSTSKDYSFKYITMDNEVTVNSISFNKVWSETAVRKFMIEWSYLANIGDKEPVTEIERFIMVRRGDSLRVMRMDETNTAVTF